MGLRVAEGIALQGAHSLQDTRRGPCLVIGGGHTVWDDLDRLPENAKTWPRVVVNDIGQYMHQPIEHWVTLHPEFMWGWRYFRDRHAYGQGNHYTTHSIDKTRNRKYEAIDAWWNAVNNGGTSGLFAIFVALMMGYDKVIICGIPMDGGPHFFDPPTAKFHAGSDKTVTKIWTAARDRLFQGRVTSMSGRTREWLGAP